MLKRSSCSNIEPSTWIQQLIHTKGNRGVANTAQHNSRQVQVYVSNENIFGLLWAVTAAAVAVAAVYCIASVALCMFNTGASDSARCSDHLFVYIFLSLCFPRNSICNPAVRTTFGASFPITVSRVIFLCCWCCCLLNFYAMHFGFYFVSWIYEKNNMYLIQSHLNGAKACMKIN